MSNPSFRSGPITLPAAEVVSGSRLVELTADGVRHASATGPVFGAVSSSAAPAAPRDEGDVTLGAPEIVAVHSSPASLPIESDDDFELGAEVFAAADGKVTGSGSVSVGIAVAPSAGGRVRVRLTTPAAAPSGE